MKKTFAVLGLGDLGLNVVEALTKQNAEVIAIDIVEERVARASAFTDDVYICDMTNRIALEEIGVQNVDHAIVTVGNSIQATILTTILLKDMGVEKITVRIDDNLYGPVILRLGATDVINPQELAGFRIANKVLSDTFSDYFNLEEDFGVVEMALPDNFVPENLSKLDWRTRRNINILLVRRDDKIFSPTRGTTLKPNDSLFIFGKQADLYEFEDAIRSTYGK